ncbi:MAG: hypothetical protein NVSMB38_18850 [Ktedonobacteraceae bacterium]
MYLRVTFCLYGNAHECLRNILKKVLCILASNTQTNEAFWNRITTPPCSPFCGRMHTSKARCLQSVTYAQSILSDFALPSTTIAAVSQMILSTKTHQTEESNTDYHILLDADLAILGAPALDYDSYAQAIRQEYSWVPEASYKTGRMQVLQAFLQRKRIYWTELAYVALEGQARENIQREIALLS